MNQTLRALLRYVMATGSDTSCISLREHVLGLIYHREMKLVDVLSVVLQAYEQALFEPRFELPGRCSASLDLLLAPIQGSSSLNVARPLYVQTRYSVEQFYGAMIAKMLSDLSLTRVDWCAEELQRA
ncbi:hypothetical protein [Burkholderia contaminans]|uniref:hypothetical protein n=1 Tax=Burkholderia contaminans TaxID=488447 RepID=UPI000CFED2A1|nr:hypothetical protein [Burkholderia contaminans]PRD92262.1 hypothetical protein C6P88_16525 [Burkholderia contaminans]